MRCRTVLNVSLMATLLVACDTNLPAPSRTADASSAPTPDATSSQTVAAPTLALSPRPSPSPSPSARPSGSRVCTPKDNSEWSVARRWNEALLDAIRRSLPNPPVHARNLFHLSVAMWDAWAVYDPAAAGFMVTEKDLTSDPERARGVAISYAAWLVLRHRFQKAVGAEESLEDFDRVLGSLCLPIVLLPPTAGSSATAVGARIAQAVIAHGLADGANEAGGYAPGDYRPVNRPLVISSIRPFTMVDPNRWQPLEIPGGQTQNGISTPALQAAIGPHWGQVLAFGAKTSESGTLIDPGPPPLLGDPVTDAALKAQVVEIIRDSAALDPRTGSTIDVSPAARGENPLGTNDGHGYRVNPVTGAPYVSSMANTADLYRVMAEHWADGPRSETPPGHWNVIANSTSDALEADGSLRVGATGPELDRLAWDVKLYLALNGAVHNAAIAAWGLKGRYDSVRPISLIRYMGGLGQSSDPGRPSYDVSGLPLVRGLIELVTAASSAPGERHQRLDRFIGRVAIRSWKGTPDDPSNQTAGARWMLATDFTPYQLPSFVTPSFPGYVSGHSTFSRAAAEVLTSFTGSAYFPGGLSRITFEPGSLALELGPSQPVSIEWATYYDAADQAGQSRLFGGIHIQADDFTGRRVGSTCGLAAWRLAIQYYEGRVEPNATACG